ncbi:hypothetical protein MHB42_00795 [Lysinibacillus sp. FSL K6-0232]|uniref:hypothetical protein n=1 Tax=Lysinibacillus sp. FSL K6-0232 TaxID=2921425 RepID=UPI0030F92B8A
MNIFKYKHEYVLVYFKDGKHKVASPKLTFKEAHEQRNLLWNINPLGLLPTVVEVTDAQRCFHCEKMFDNEIVYEVKSQTTPLYKVYCLNCAEAKAIDFYDAKCQIFIEV